MRTEYCGQLRQSHVGQQVTLCGWVNRRRDLGSLIFIDMRDAKVSFRCSSTQIAQMR